MNVDLHEALTTLADAGPRRAAPTTRLLARVHRRRASRAVATSAVGVGAAGALAVTSLGWWPQAAHHAPAATQATGHATPATDVPPVPGSTAVWDLYPDSALDVGTAQTRTVDEALAVVQVATDAVENGSGAAPFLMDAADGAWVRPSWPAGTTSRILGVFALSPDGRTVAAWAEADDGRAGVDLVDVSTGARTPVTGLEHDGHRCLPADADYAPDGTLAVLATCDADAGPVVAFRVATGTATAQLLVTVEGTNLASGGALEYSPDGSLLAICSYDVAEPYTPRTTVVDADGAVVHEWPAALRNETVWYGNNALRASQLEQTADGEWKGWLIPSTGAAIGEIHSYDENPWEYGPAPTPLGATHGQEIRPHLPTAAEQADPSTAKNWAIDLEDAASGMVRAWLPVLDSTAPADRQPTLTWGATTLALRTR